MESSKKYHLAGWQTGNPALYKVNREMAIRMRKEPTEAEARMWEIVKGGKLGTKVRRQVTIGEYIADFYVPQYKIVVEIDGGYHLQPNQIEEDRKRQDWLEANGYKVIRFMNEECLNDIEKVKEILVNELQVLKSKE